MKGYANCSDDMLVQAYMEGKDSAFDELLARNQQQLFDFILALTRDKDKADDLFQEGFALESRKVAYCGHVVAIAWLL